MMIAFDDFQINLVRRSQFGVCEIKYNEMRYDKET